MPTDPPRHEVVKRVNSTTTSTNYSGLENPSEHTTPQSPPTDFFYDSQEDTLLYPYPRYNDKDDAEAHIPAYLTTWQANPCLQAPRSDQGKHLQDCRVRAISGRASSELVLTKRYGGFRGFRPAPQAVYPDLSSKSSPAGADEPVLCDHTGSYGDGTPFLHPLRELEEETNTILHTRGTHRDIPDRLSGAARHGLGSRGPHGKAN